MRLISGRPYELAHRVVVAGHDDRRDGPGRTGASLRDVVAYELPRSGYTLLLSEQPVIATKLLTNLSRELARRLRRTSEDLRNRT